MTSNWIHNGIEVESIDIEKYPAFVYMITNNVTGMKYIGKKYTSKTVKRPPLKGKIRKRKVTSNSDWKTYWSSSERLLEDVSKLGEENFTREILYFCTTKAMSTYVEAKLQFENGVLESDEWYNGIINLRLGGVAIKKANYYSFTNKEWEVPKKDK